MFRRIDYQWDSDVTHGPPITALLRTILKNPELGKNIKELNLQAVNYRGFQAPGFNGDILLPSHTHRIPASDWEMFEKALETCPCEEKGECDDPTTREGNLNAGIGVLISCCTRVESLSIDIELLMHNYRLPAMLRSTLYRSLGPWGKLSWFEKLNQVTISHTDAYQGPPHHGKYQQKYAESLPVPTQTFLHLFYLPNLRTLDVSFFPDALDHVHRTLKILVIQVELFGDTDNGFGGMLISSDEVSMVCVNALGQLRDFAALVSLETSLAVLYGQVVDPHLHPLAGLLPPNLQRLVINDDLWAASSTFPWNELMVLSILRCFLIGQTLADGWPGDACGNTNVSWVTITEPEWRRATPQLSGFVLDFKKRGWIEHGVLRRSAQRRSLEQACEDQGIRCEIQHDTFDPDDVPYCEDLT
ncbi:uncharacterized protein N0V89_000998 [Didymosphaeria variabile]|uniref:Uncharacterized protein n=1 Tax=Didymosphaeria variabile TaxID=1932322 RepID=A0A9W8XXL5_9PLEO|nr:uncharacterized protein N0V89_000998 [Didymosphaeria variabile]KAJ4360435.1 hypothetical protein N0V89_000998 [Didymosphaeria variabile]